MTISILKAIILPSVIIEVIVMIIKTRIFEFRDGAIGTYLS